MRFLPLINPTEARRLVDHDVLAVDLGFSGKGRTTGVAYRAEGETVAQNLRFGEALDKVADRLRSAAPCVLILEAPLSFAFGPAGNPQPRGRFETHRRSRWWSVGPGAVTFLSAFFFLRGLQDRLPDSPAELRLVEAFVTGKASGSHSKVAAKILRSFREPKEQRWCDFSKEVEARSVLTLLDAGASPAPPLILHPR